MEQEQVQSAEQGYTQARVRSTLTSLARFARTAPHRRAPDQPAPLFTTITTRYYPLLIQHTDPPRSHRQSSWQE